MKHKLHTVIIAAIFLAATPAVASEDKPHGQQDKFSQCAHESKGLKGEEHSKFMSECLKGHDAQGTDKAKPNHAAEKSSTVREARNEPEAHESQQGRMKSCNEEAGRKGLHGEERRAFMSACLKVRD